MAGKAEATIWLRAKDKTKEAVSSAKSGFSSLADKINLGMVAAAGAAVIAVKKLTDGIGAAISAANEQEDAVKRLDTSLADLGPRAKDVSSALQDQAAALQKQTTYGDEAIIGAQSLLAAFIKDEDQLKAATKATLDLAAAKKMDLRAAADLVAKSVGSSTNALSRYGIEVEGAVGSSERLESLTRNVADVFGGQAAAAAETFRGRVTQLKNAWGDLILEGLGKAITENKTLTDTIDRITKALGSEGAKKAVEKATEAFAAFVSGAIAVVDALSPLFSLVKDLVGIWWDLQNILVDVATYLGSTVYNAIRKVIDQFRPLKDLVTETSEALSGFWGWLKDSTHSLRESADALKDEAIAASRAEDRIKGASTATQELTTTTQIATTVTGDMKKSVDGLKKSTDKATSSIKTADDVLKALGLTVETNTNEALRENRRQEDLLTKAYEEGSITLDTYTSGLEKLREKADELANSTEEVAGRTDTLSSSFEQTTAKTETLTSSAGNLAASIDRVNLSLARASDSARITWREFDRLEEIYGTAAAVEAALAGGATLSMGGRRIRLPGGGSRLTTDPHHFGVSGLNADGTQRRW